MFSILWVFLQNAAAQIWYAALHLESGSFPRPLSLAQEREAFAAMQRGDVSARDTLISHNLRLVAHVVKKYYAAPGGQDDMISIGTIGLIKAVDTFRPERKVRFSSYASQCIEMLSSQKGLFGNSGWNIGTDFPAFAKMEGVRPGLAGFLHTLLHRPRQAPLCAPGRAPVPPHRAPQPAGSPAFHPAVPQL